MPLSFIMPPRTASGLEKSLNARFKQSATSLHYVTCSINRKIVKAFLETLSNLAIIWQEGKQDYFVLPMYGKDESQNQTVPKNVANIYAAYVRIINDL